MGAEYNIQIIYVTEVLIQAISSLVTQNEHSLETEAHRWAPVAHLSVYFHLTEMQFACAVVENKALREHNLNFKQAPSYFNQKH